MPQAEAVSQPISRLVFGQDLTHDTVMVAAEVAVEIRYGVMPHAVMMASPQNLTDFAYGFSFTEGVIGNADEIVTVEEAKEERGIVLTLSLQGAALSRNLMRKRALAGRTSCGLCGVESLDDLQSESRTVSGPLIGMQALQRAIAELEQSQPLNGLTRATHAAAWVNLAGEITRIREDVGRHNALDKLIGALLRAKLSAESGFLLLTSRLSFEMVDKAASFGIRTLCAISAPTTLALEKAKANGQTLIAVARPDGARLYCGAIDG